MSCDCNSCNSCNSCSPKFDENGRKKPEHNTRIFGVITMQDIKIYLGNYEAKRFIKQLEIDGVVDRVADGIWQMRK